MRITRAAFSCHFNMMGKQMADFRVFLVPFICHHYRSKTLFIATSDLFMMYAVVNGLYFFSRKYSNQNCAGRLSVYSLINKNSGR